MERKILSLCRGPALLGVVLAWHGAVRAQDRPVPMPPPVGDTSPEAPLPRPNPLAADPKTPEQLLEATFLMVDIARPDLAAMYFDKFMSLDLDDAALLGFRDQFGLAPFLRLTNVKELQGPAEKLLDRLNTVAAARVADRSRVVRLLEQLESDDPEERAVGESELRALGPLLAPGIVSALADPTLEKHREPAMATLVEVGDGAISPLLGGLQTPDDRLRADLITVLGRLRSPRAAPYLWYHALSPKEVPAVRGAARQALSRILGVPETGVERIASEGTIARLMKIASEHYRHQYPWTAEPDGNVLLWSWSEDTKTVVPVPVTPDQASDITGLTFARQALALAPESRKVHALYLSLALAADFNRVGFDKSLPTGPGTAHDLALSAGSPTVADVLGEALAAGRPTTAVAALKVLEQIGTKAQLGGADGKRSPLVAALDYPDPRVQFAAATAILQIDPAASFRGAPRVVEILKRSAASASGKPFAVVGEVSAGRGAQIGGFLRNLGYEPLVFVNGRDAFRAAAERGDVELIVLHPNLIRWALSETVANLRADSRTAGIPIVIHSPSELLPRLKQQTHDYRLVSLATLTITPEAFESQVRPILSEIKTPPLTDLERSSMRRKAIGWLAHLAAGHRTKVFDITSAQAVLIEAIADPRLAQPALEALSEIPTSAAQLRIAELVLDVQPDLELRQVAALKLAFHVQRFGLLIPTDTIAGLNRLWSDDQQPPALRTALGSVIGSLKPDDALVGKRLQAFPVR